MTTGMNIQVKKSAYQKLKDKNKELERLLWVLALTPDSVEAISIRFNVKLNRDCENAIMAGNPTDQ